jgi:glycosyltransferase involved in cell wall biosynthesis
VTDPTRVLVVTPAWNEEATVAAVVRDVRAQGFDVVVVDDGSSDATSQRARAAGATVLRLPINLGVGAALRCGFRFAVSHGYSAVVQCDADGQHSPAAIESLVAEASRTGAHFVLGSRFASDTPSMAVTRPRRWAMRMLARSASRATRTRITDATSGFRLIRDPLLSQFAANFPAHYLGDTYEALISAGRGGYDVAEIPVTIRDRSHGRSSASALAAIRLISRSLIVSATRLHFPIEPLGR